MNWKTRPLVGYHEGTQQYFTDVRHIGDGYFAQMVHSAIKSGNPYRDCLWRWASEEDANLKGTLKLDQAPVRKCRHNSIPVCCLHKGVLAKCYPSMSSVAEDGFCYGTINIAVHTHWFSGGYRWRKMTNVEIATVDWKHPGSVVKGHPNSRTESVSWKSH